MPTIGRADIDVHYDGKGLPEEARRLGEESGQAAGEEHAKAFDKEVKEGQSETAKELEKKWDEDSKRAGENGGKRFAKSFDDAFDQRTRGKLNKLADDVAKVFSDPGGFDEYRKNFDSVGDAADALGGKLELLAENGQLSDERFVQLHDDVRKWAVEAEKAEAPAARLAGALTNLRESIGDEFRDHAREAALEIGRVGDETDDLKETLRGDLIERLGKQADETQRVADASAKLKDSLHGDLIERLGKQADETRRVADASADLKDALQGDLIERLGKQADEFDRVAQSADHVVDRIGPMSKGEHDLGGAMREVDSAVARLNPGLDTHNELIGRINDTYRNGGTEAHFRGLAREAETLAGKAEKTAGALLHLGDGADDGGKKAGASAGGFGKLFSTFSQFDPGDNIGQLIALIIAFAPQIAVLASAAGGGLLILAGAVTALGLAAVGGIVGFSNFFGDVRKLPESVQPAARAVQGLKDDFGDLRRDLQIEMFKGLADGLANLERTAIPAVDRAFKTLGGALNTVLAGMIRDLNSSGFDKDLNAIFSGAKPVIEDLGNIVRNTFGVIGALIEDVLPSTHDFTKGVGDALGKFNEFLRSPEGKTAVQDFLKDAKRILGEVGGVIAEVSKAFGKLVANPKNVQDTANSLQALASAGPKLLQLGENLGTLAAAAVKAIDILSSIFEGASRVVDPLLTGIEVTFAAVTTKSKAFVDGLKAIFGQLPAVMEGAASVFKGFAQAATGDYAGAVVSFQTGSAKIKGAFGEISKAAGEGLGNASSAFDRLDTNSQAKLTSIAGKLGFTGDAAKTFGGNLSQNAQLAGIKLSDLDAGGKVSLTSLANKLGLTKDAAQVLLYSGIDPLSLKGGAGLSDLAAKATTHLGTITSKLGLTGRDAATFKDAIVTSTSGSDAALRGLAGAKSWGDIGNALDKAGTLSKTQFANKIIASSNESGASIDKLPPKIQDLVAKYGTIPATKSTKVSAVGVDATIGELSNLYAKLAQNVDKRINVTTYYSAVGTDAAKGQAGRGAIGGIMAGGKLVAGGKRGWGEFGRGIMAFASGGIVRRPTLFGNVLTGEAGAEAIVPLTGPLNQVDKSVRELAAYARGMQPYAQAPGRQITVAPGAITVRSNVVDGRQVAAGVVERLDAVVGSF